MIRFQFAVALAAGSALCGPALADLSGDAITVDASSTRGSARWVLPQNALTYNPTTQTWSWSSDGSIELRTNQQLIGVIQQMNFRAVGDPQIALDFVANAASGVPTSFTISSALLSFPTITNATGRASAGNTITDSDGLGNGATLTGTNAGGTTYRANYNGLVPAGTTLASIIPGASAGAFGSNSISAANPAVGFANIGSVSSLSVRWSFDVSARRQRSGTSIAVVLPALGALALAGIAGLMATRRRR